MVGRTILGQGRVVECGLGGVGVNQIVSIKDLRILGYVGVFISFVLL